MKFKNDVLLRKHRSSFPMAVFCIIVFREKKGPVIMFSQHVRGDSPTDFFQVAVMEFSTLACNSIPRNSINTARVALGSERKHGSKPWRVCLTRDGFQSVAPVAKNKNAFSGSTRMPCRGQMLLVFSLQWRRILTQNSDLYPV